VWHDEGMTQEKKCFVFPVDVSAVRLQCKNCGAASIIPVAKLADRDRTKKTLAAPCHYCNQPSGFNPDSMPCASVVGFCDTLGNLAGSLQGVNVELSLQVECAE